MKHFTLRVDNGYGIENIWTGDSLEEAIKFEDKASALFGRDNVWICDNVMEAMCG